jgi:SAM-dependent methyltransferase
MSHQEGLPAPDLSVAATIVEVARDLSRSVPPPRGAPYFCLDSDAAYDLSVLSSFSERGIFRKYEFALDIGSGLGGRARWLATRFGCRILGVDPRPPVVAGATALNRRARMDAQVAFQVGQFEHLPLRSRVFTYVWMVDLPLGTQSVRTCAEGFRVLRPGGHFAMQCAVVSAVARNALLDMLASVGFINLEVFPVACAELSPPCRLARDRLRGSGVQPIPSCAPILLPTALQIFGARLG